ncbi:MAG: hypothetical protein ABIS03_07740 [Gemmatimonadaceae bacterium]
MRKRLLLVTVLGGCVAAPTTADNTTPAPVIQVQAGQQFQIVIGQDARLQKTGIVIKLVSVAEDSRCPSDVQCVWAGNARLALDLSGGATGSTRSSVNLTLDPQSVSYGGYVIRFVSLEPVPRSGKAIPASNYVATLEAVAG